jgi:lipoprotein NlpI
MASLKPLLFLFVLGISLSGTCAHAQQPAPSTGPDADSLVKQGIASGTKGDMNGAIAFFNQAIKVDPKFAPAYQNRGFAFSLQNNLDAAIADYDQAIQLDPKYVEAYYNRGTAKGQKGDFDGAITDFNHVLELHPQTPPAYYNRGHAKYFKGDLEGATSDLNQAIAMAPAHASAYFIRGLVRHAQGDGVGAGSDFKTSADDGFYYGAFWFWIVKMEAADQGIAHQELSDYAAKPGFFQNDTWAPLIADFLLGKITQDQLMAKAQAAGVTNDRFGEAWFYAGMVKILSGDIKGAQDCFQKSIATQAKGSEEVTEAQRELTKLQPPGL